MEGRPVRGQFANPVYGGQDPFVCKGPDGRYYSVAESADSRRIDVYASDRLTDRGICRTAYVAPDSGPSCADLWAPELWHLRGKWYIYYAGASGRGERNWHTHRMFVLESDHPLGPYRPAGRLELGERMSIDGTVMELPDGRLLFFYMGRCDGMNALFVAPMASPTKIAGPPRLLCRPEYPWEADINEGPFPIVRQGKVRLLYAANAAHLPAYCLGLLCCTDPSRAEDPAVWVKEPQPVLTGTDDILGPGHACIVPSPDGTEDWLVFHSKFDREEALFAGWNRVVNLLRVRWDDRQRPVFDPLPRRGEPRPVPSGEPPLPQGKAVRLLPGRAADRLVPYGYARAATFFYEGDALRIDGASCPDFGDKALLRDGVFGDFAARVRFQTISGEGEAGFLFRVTLPAAGRWLYRGYGVYLTGQGDWRLIRNDGGEVSVLAAGRIPKGEVRLLVEARGERIRLSCEGELLCDQADPGGYPDGQVGFGTLGGQGRFTGLSVEPEEPAFDISQVVSVPVGAQRIESSV